MPRAWPISSAARTIARFLRSLSRSFTSTRSSLRRSTGRYLRYDSEEYPTPKSSMARRTPSSLRRCSILTLPPHLYQDALGDLQREAPGVQGATPQSVVHLADEFGISELTGGEVYGHG